MNPALSPPNFRLADFLSYRPFPPDDELRDQVEQAIERHLDNPDVDGLIALLDSLDGDVDLEPSFGWVQEGVLDESEDGADDEFALGALEILDQSRWGEDFGGHLRINIDRELDIAES